MEAVTLQTGERVGDYTIESLIGTGAFGSTYKAHDQAGCLVALKIPDPDLLGDIPSYERFRREAEISGRLDHPAIPKVREMTEDSRGPFLVAEYVEGQSFRTYLQANAPLELDEALGFASQIASMLGHIHAAGVYHRDLKPENLLLAADGSLHLVDFGIAVVEGSERLTFRFLSDIVGTPEYVSPEQIQGHRGDGRGDLYALGILLYEMLTGTTPFKGTNTIELIEQHLKATATAPRDINPLVPPEVEAIIFKAIRKDPAERYQTAAEFASDIAHYEDLDLSLFDFAAERGSDYLYSDRMIWRLGLAIGAGFLATVVLIVGIAMLL